MGESTVLSIILRLFLFLDFIFFQKQTERLVFAVVWPAVGCRLSIATRAASCRVGSESWELLLTFLFGGQRGPPYEKKKMRKRYIERKIESAVWRRVTSSNCMVWVTLQVSLDGCKEPLWALTAINLEPLFRLPSTAFSFWPDGVKSPYPLTAPCQPGPALLLSRERLTAKSWAESTAHFMQAKLQLVYDNYFWPLSTHSIFKLILWRRRSLSQYWPHELCALFVHFYYIEMMELGRIFSISFLPVFSFF